MIPLFGRMSRRSMSLQFFTCACGAVRAISRICGNCISGAGASVCIVLGCIQLLCFLSCSRMPEPSMTSRGSAVMIAAQ